MTALESYRRMWRIRLFEEAVDRLFAEGVLRGTSHLCVGQEATAVGTCAALRPTDYVTSTHRGHGHFLAKGGDPQRVMAELFGKATGYARGRGGSQHMACYALGFLGSNGITGGGIPIATGAALAIQRRRADHVVACFFGDGAANQGVFHESLNLAGLWKLPVIYVCENNLYAMSTPVRAAFAVPHVALRASCYAMPGVTVDGNDYFAVYQAVEDAAERARRGEGPTLIECQTYRFVGHSRGDRCVYRTREEEAAWRARDPIPRLRQALFHRGELDEAADERLRQEVEQEIEEAMAFARSSPVLPAEAAREGVYA
ncbi:MAG: thiamine pyrophosphate-dependent dehydrogenase E1 component subunit alpha [Armatimonadota bacterium]|nr:thiamine pyrophosphate-dependent dehydrogenase E1 component subunit alpha [Armatimonadota bacterium]